MENEMNMNEMENQVEETKKGFSLKKGLTIGAVVTGIVLVGGLIYDKVTKGKKGTQEEPQTEEPIECEVEECEEVPEEEE